MSDTGEVDEAQLWERALRDDGDAFGTLFDLHRDRVWRRAIGVLADPHDAEDVTAAAFFELWRRRRSVRVVGGSVLPWLLVTAANLSRNAHRSTARYGRFLRGIPRSNAVEPPDAEAIERRERLAASLGALARDDAALIVLTALEGFSIAEAARVVGVTPAAARMRVHRARLRLRSELDDLRPHIRSEAEGARP